MLREVIAHVGRPGYDRDTPLWNADKEVTMIRMEFRERYVELIDIINEFCEAHLDSEYKDVCHKLTGDLCQDGSPILSGKAKSWAAGIVWAIGRVNFLSDPSFEPCMKQADFAKAIGVSAATISAKCRDIWEGLELMQFDPDYTVASRQESNPLRWIVEVDGFLLDLRSAPREIQEAAYEQGVIPYIRQGSNGPGVGGPALMSDSPA